MKCSNTIKLLDEYLDGVLPPRDAVGVHGHLEGCPSCRAELGGLKALRQQLAALPVPAVRDDVLERLLATAIQTPVEQPGLWRQPAWQRAGLATAAVLLLVVGFGLGVRIAGHKPLEPGPQVALAAQPVQLGPTAERVGLMFRTTDALHDASISVWLPDDVQIKGRPNVRHLSWRTDLKAGPNLLELPLLATGTHGGTLVVRLSQGSLVKTLEIPIELWQPKDPGATLPPAPETRAIT